MTEGRAAPRPVVLLTRPEAAARRFAADLPACAARVVIAPLQRIVAVDHDAARLAGAEGLIFTSENAVPAAGPGRGRPAICVGARTAAVARAAGFDVTVGPGDAAGMRPLLARCGPGWLHPQGVHLAADLGVPGIVVYDQQPCPLTAEAEAVLAGDAPVIWPLFSPRSARLAAAAARAVTPGAGVWHLLAISPAAAAGWAEAAAPRPPPLMRLHIVPHPDAAALRAAVETVLDRETSGGAVG